LESPIYDDTTVVELCCTEHLNDTPCVAPDVTSRLVNVDVEYAPAVPDEPLALLTLVVDASYLTVEDNVNLRTGLVMIGVGFD
jgi:hypothetical protein